MRMMKLEDQVIAGAEPPQATARRTRAGTGTGTAGTGTGGTGTTTMPGHGGRRSAGHPAER